MGLFTWAGRYRFRERLRSSMWAVPMAFAVGAAILEELFLQAGTRYAPPEDFVFSAGAATTVLAAIAGSMMTVTGIVFSVLTLTVQHAGAAISPRVVRTFYRDRVVKVSLGLFVGTFTYAIVLIPDADKPGAGLAIAVGVLMALVATGTFLVMVNHVGQGLRAASMVSRVSQATAHAVDDVHPESWKPRTPQQDPEPPDLERASRVVHYRGPSGVVIAADFNGLARYAARKDGVIELVPAVGDFISTGTELLRIVEGRHALRDRRLSSRVAVSDERSLDQDPAFGLRILADTAIKALSPGVNDPTTAVVALDRIHDLLRVLINREIDGGQILDAHGRLRLRAATPTWDDYLTLALTETIHYGADAFQVPRRLRALLDELDHHAPAERRPVIARPIESASVERLNYLRVLPMPWGSGCVAKLRSAGRVWAPWTWSSSCIRSRSPDSYDEESRSVALRDHPTGSVMRGSDCARSAPCHRIAQQRQRLGRNGSSRAARPWMARLCLRSLRT